MTTGFNAAAGEMRRYPWFDLVDAHDTNGRAEEIAQMLNRNVYSSNRRIAIIFSVPQAVVDYVEIHPEYGVRPRILRDLERLQLNAKYRKDVVGHKEISKVRVLLRTLRKAVVDARAKRV